MRARSADRRRPRKQAAALALLTTLAATLLGAVAPVRAQSLWLDREARTSVCVETRFPDEGNDYSGSGGPATRYAAFVTARLPLRRNTWLVVEAAFARLVEQETYLADFGDFATHTVNQASVGNPYLGLEFARRVTGLHYEVGLRPPLARRGAGSALQTGFESDVEREQAFLDDTFSLRAGALYHRAAHAGSPIGYDVRAGATWQVPTADPLFAVRYGDAYPFNLYYPTKPLESRHALFVEHAVEVRLEGQHAYVGIGVAGRWLANNGAGDYGSNSVEEFSFALEILRGPVHPGLILVHALDADLRSHVRDVLGLSLSVAGGRHSRWWRAS
jgi:hypothetical protein